MSDKFEQGFFVRDAAWHKKGVVLNDYPSREKAMELAGHGFDVVTIEQDMTVPIPAEVLAGAGGWPTDPTDPRWPAIQQVDPRWSIVDGKVMRNLEGYQAHLRSDNLEVLHVSKDTFEPIPNSVAYEIAELLFDEGFQYETGITLDGGKVCAITLKLNEPIQIPGDDSIILPFGCLSWAHDGSGSYKIRSGKIRMVCANTVAASEAEGKKLGTDFTIKHTKNWRERIADAKEAVMGMREQYKRIDKVLYEMAEIDVTPDQRDLYVSHIIGDVTKDGTILSQTAATSNAVKNNIEKERTKVLSLFMGPTIPEAHQLTGYGLLQAGGEYFDHLRAYRSDESYVRRTLLSDSKEKASLTSTIRKIAAAA